MKVNMQVTGIDEFVSEVDSTIHTTARILVIEIWKNLMLTTPVSSGRARANWGISKDGSIQELPPGEYSEPERPPISRFNTLFITNPLDYIQYLNEGWSEQAPALFIEIAVADAEVETNQRVTSLKTGKSVGGRLL